MEWRVRLLIAEFSLNSSLDTLKYTDERFISRSADMQCLGTV